MPATTLPIAALTHVAAFLWTPDPIAFQLGPVPVYWYGVCYAIGLALAYLVITREARRRGLDPRYVDNGIIIIAVAALIGGRLYHVIDQWHLYQDNLLKIVMPPYTGLGVYGGILTGTIACVIVVRLWRQPFWKWADVIAPGLFVMQAVGRWGNFFNQELYGPPTTLPWGIPIDCIHRVGDHGIAQYGCDAGYPPDTLFHPLFLYESISGIVGAITLLWIARRWGPRMRPGDLFLIFLIWYAVVRLLLETLRTGNWTLLGVPTAMVVSALVIVGSLVVLAIRHRPGAADGDRWGEPPVPEDELYDDDTVEVDADDAAVADAIDDLPTGADDEAADETDDEPGTTDPGDGRAPAGEDGAGDAARPPAG